MRRTLLFVSTPKISLRNKLRPPASYSTGGRGKLLNSTVGVGGGEGDGCLGEVPKIPPGIFPLLNPVLPGCLQTYALLHLFYKSNFAKLLF